MKLLYSKITLTFFFCIQVSNRDRKMSSLQSQLHDLHKEISRRDSEITTHQQTIKMMQEKQRYLSGEVSQHFSILLKFVLQIKCCIPKKLRKKIKSNYCTWEKSLSQHMMVYIIMYRYLQHIHINIYHYVRS